MARFNIKMKKAAKKKHDKSKTPEPFPYKKMIISLSILLIIAVTFTSFYVLYFKTPFFVVQDVIMVGKVSDTSVNYDDLQQLIMDKNIFKLDLSVIRSYMLCNYQELLDLQFSRAFPNSIIAFIILRKPVAWVHQEFYYPVDTDGVILSGVKDYPDKDLPVISGVRSSLERHVGRATDSRRVKTALLLLKELSSSGILNEHKLVEIDISSIRNAIFFLEDGLEIKIGNKNYASRLENLKKILQDPKIKPIDIRYVDLRFKEPVIGPKWKR